MSNPLPEPDGSPTSSLTAEEADRWSDLMAYREEFRRRLAERGILLPPRARTNCEKWVPPVPLPVSADEASAMVIRMRREEN